MKVTPLAIPDVKLIQPRVFGDERGFFLETWNAARFQDAELDLTFVQDNWSRSTRGVLRGLHYQLTFTQGKLVRCVAGEVFDVAVDIRRSSPTFGCWVGARLSETNKHSLWVPPGFAHGFVTLSESADFHYKCTGRYHPESERTIRWDDPKVGIEWPIGGGITVQLSEKDATQGKALAEAEVFA